MLIHHWLAEWSSWIWPFLCRHLWEATLFAALAFVVTLLLRQGPARARHLIWLLASAKFALPSVLFLCLGQHLGLQLHWRPLSSAKLSPPERLLLPTVYGIVEPIWVLPKRPASTLGHTAKHNEFLCAFTLMWPLGCLVLFGAWVKRRHQFTQIIRSGCRAQTGRETEILQQARSRLSENRHIELVISSKVSEPGVWGIWKPVVVLPRGIADHLSDDELEALMMHELAHVKHRDNLTCTVQLWLCFLLWFYPIVWFIDKKLLLERERACDEDVLRLTIQSRCYATSLLKVLRFCLSWRVAGVSSAVGSNLKRRVEYIMSDNIRKLTSWHRLSIAFLAAILVVSSVVAGLLRHEDVLANSNERNTGPQNDGLAKVLKGLERVTASAETSFSKGAGGGLGDWRDAGSGAIEAKIGAAKEQILAGKMNPRETKEGLNQTEQAPVLTQKATGKLSGSVRDASGARIPDAIVTVAMFGGHSKEIVYTNDVGEYEFPQLPEGTYEVEISKDGFRLFQRKDIVVNAKVQERVDVIMELGEVFQTVEVTAKPPQAAKGTFMGVGPPRRIRVGGNVQQANLISQTKPIYPEQAQQAGIEGTVLLEAIIGKDGSVVNYRVVNTLAHPFLVKAAVEAVQQWLYKPTLLNGEPVEVVTNIAVSFRLSQTE